MDRSAERIRLELEDGSVFDGVSFGAETGAAGEIVFNTGMVGYPESLTDPSYRGQILVFTHPLIGNYGVPGPVREDSLLKHFESDKIQVRGVVVADYSSEYSHWNSLKSLSKWLRESGVPGISGVDTRRLTKILREKGTMLGRIEGHGCRPPLDDPNRENLVAEVSIKETMIYQRGEKKIVIVDCGVKNNIIRAFLNRGFTVVRMPWNGDFLMEEADGVIVSNGPGDPKMCGPTIEHVRRALSENVPILGICLGSQILALAAGADTYKLKYGHRGQNQPCVEVGTRRCYITSQNHGYAVDSGSLPEDWREWFFNNNDRTNEGIFHISKPFFGTQFHPEASPGPDDTEYVFDMFLRAVK
jgi:carbamoyl-phosphate synthase small subunit